MNVTIFGAGKMGHAIGRRIAPAGHAVTYVSRTAEHARQTADEVGKAAAGKARVDTSTHEDVKLGEVVVLAVKYATALELVKQLGSRLDGKVVMDITNAFNATYDGLALPPDTSAAEEIARAAAPGVQVVKAFNTIYSATLEQGRVDGQQLDVFIAGDDASAREKVARLVRDGGMRPVDCGPLKNARLIEAAEMLHMLAASNLDARGRSTMKILS